MPAEEELAYKIASLMSPIKSYIPFALFGIRFDGKPQIGYPFMIVNKGKTVSTWTPYASTAKKDELSLWLIYAASTAGSWPDWNTKMSSQTFLPLVFTGIWYHCDKVGGKCGSLAVTLLCKALASCTSLRNLILLSADIKGEKVKSALAEIEALARGIGGTTYSNVINCLVPALS